MCFPPNPVISKIINDSSRLIKSIEKEHNIPEGYIQIDLALHLFQYDEKVLLQGDETNYKLIKHESLKSAKSLQKQLKELPKNFYNQIIQKSLQEKIVSNKGEIYAINKTGKQNKIYFDLVPDGIGILIQTHVHYLGCARKDSLFHFGLYRQGEHYPFAYVAYSYLDRHYPLKALPYQEDIKNVLFLSRVFNINNSPKNSISKLLSESIKYIKQKEETKHVNTIITSLNPNLLFYGSAFTSANFVYYAQFPFEPLYYKNEYHTRKKCKSILNIKNDKKILEHEDIQTKQMKSDDIKLMAYALDKNYANILASNTNIIDISVEEYQNG